MTLSEKPYEILGSLLGSVSFIILTLWFPENDFSLSLNSSPTSYDSNLQASVSYYILSSLVG